MIRRPTGLGTGVPPDWNDVLVYFIQGGKSVSQARAFYDYFSKKAWHNARGKILRNWKVNAWQWMWLK